MSQPCPLRLLKKPVPSSWWNPEKDAKIAMNLEGAYGLFIYTLIPIAFIIVLGAKALSNASLVDPKTIFVTFAEKGSRVNVTVFP